MSSNFERTIRHKIERKFGETVDDKLLKFIIEQAKQETAMAVEQIVANEIKQFESDVDSELNQLAGITKKVTGLNVPLPEGTKFASHDGNVSIFIVEQRPQVRSINGGAHRLAFPYLVMGFVFLDSQIQTMTLCARKNPLQSIDDELYYMQIGNIYREPYNIGVCMTFHDTGRLSVAQKVEKYISDFWQTQFGGVGYYAGGVTTPSDDLRSFQSWANATTKDPSFILKIDWQPVKTGHDVLTVRQLIKSQEKLHSKKGKNKFYPIAKNLSIKVQNQIFEKIELNKPAIPEIKPEIEVEVKADIENDINNPMFKQKIKVKRGQKLCPHCNAINGARTKICNCGYDFVKKEHPQRAIEKKAEAAIERLKQKPAEPQLAEQLKPILVVKPRLKRKWPRKLKPKNDPAKNNPAKALTRGRKACPRCGLVVGARTKECPECGHTYY